MASTAGTFSVSSPSAFAESKAHCQLVAPSPQSVTLPTLSPSRTLHSKNRLRRSTVQGRRKSQNVVAMATRDTNADAGEIELPDIVKKSLAAWEKVDDKFAVTSLGVASLIALWGSAGLISAIDRLPIIPGMLELLGIGCTGWFAYKNLVFKPEREALIGKITETYNNVTGSS